MSQPAPVLGPIGELKAHAHLYGQRGLEVFPLLADKAPRTNDGFKDATTDPAQIEAWWTAHPDDLIGHRIASHHLVLDIDPRHGGDKTWAAIRKECGGAFPVTRVHASGRGDGGGHTWWLRPDDKLTSIKLDAFAREHGTGHAVIDKTTGEPYITGGVPRWTSGIDILHHDLRYTILPPSPHPVSNAPYFWRDGRGLEVPPAPMPAFLADLITLDTPISRPVVPRDPDPTSIADWYSSHHHVGDLLHQAGWLCVAGDGRQDGSRWRHPLATSSCSATIRHGCLFVYTPNTPFDVTGPGDSHGYTAFRAYAVLQHHGDVSNAARAARALKDGPTSPRVNPADLIAPTAAAAPQAVPQDPAAHLPETFWTSRPILEQIRIAARSKLVSPDAVLGACLARVAAIAPHSIEIPDIVGSPCGLTFFAALVGPPESGKSAAAAIAANLIPAPDHVLDRLPAGSGEGMVEVLFEMRDEHDGTKKVKVKRQTKYAAIFHIDEGQVLGDLAARSGSTLMPTLRTAWTHGTLGNTNASAERRRTVEGHQYTYGITLGIQPELAGPLLADVGGGTPQRFVWFMATDPSATGERVTWPGELPWNPPTAKDLEEYSVLRKIQKLSWQRYQFNVTPAIDAEVWAYRLEGTQGEARRDIADAHRMLSQLKIAALIALLTHPTVLLIDDEDWELAGTIRATSSRIRRQVEGSVVDVERRRDDAVTSKLGRREVGVAEMREHRLLTSASRTIGETVAKHAAAGRHDDQGGGCSRRCFTQTMSKQQREVGVDAAASEAERVAWVEAVGERWIPGSSRPA